MENNNNSRPHLVYMTGLSVNKKFLNEIAENINFDKDFTYWRSEVQKELNQSVSKLVELLSTGKKFTNNQIDLIINALTDISELVNLFPKNTSLESISDNEINSFFDNVRNGLSKPVKSLLGKVFKVLGDNTEDFNQILNLKKLFDKNINNIKFNNSDFFSLYLSNQSDSIGLIPLAQISNAKSFKFMNSYCDWDFFENKYVDHIVLKIDREYTSNIDEKDIEDIFKLHIREIMISKALKDTYEEQKDENNEMKSLFEELFNAERYEVKDIINMFGERNFFGISLLSMILYHLDFKIKEDNIKIKIDEKGSEKEFLKELLSYSFDPKKFEFSDGASPISAKIYFSDGIKLNKNIDELSEDNYFLNTNNYSYSSKKRDKLPLINEKDKNFIKEKISQYNIHTVDFDNKDNLFTYVKKLDNGAIYIKIPIKIILSLPIKEQKRGDYELFIPDCINNEKKDVIDIITVGGAEHNRALAHLINKHRLEYKNERIYGFMDNYFDMLHKEKLDRPRILNSTSFFMGINQPVSGWNYIMLSREDNEVGESINSDVKLLTFKLKDSKQTFNILSIYGFSAIASVLGINLIIQELNERDNLDKTNQLFSNKFSEYFNHIDITKPIGTSSAIYFESKPKNIIMDEVKNKCYQYVFNYDREKYKKLFINEEIQSEIIKNIIITKL